MKPTIGRIVHFYDLNADAKDTHRKGVEINGQGAGPFPGVIVQVHGDKMVSLRCSAYGGEFTESSVELLEAGAHQSDGRFCVWPPREEEAGKKLSNTEKAAAREAEEAERRKTHGDGS